MGTEYFLDEFHFKNDMKQYIDVRICIEGHIELSTETSKKYAINTQEELDLIYQKLTEALKASHQNNVNKRGI
jgi:hypothetical protein